ncbi:TIGR03546 family protein [Aeoliella sp. ICT_H6.2]|uniref:TIGR03546 family protein n=1 Tax=Aeoliella straminimaris TaxID=2954799 RepID=A0A9X2JEL5_9BACT|nr:TIGR03546 family protein [Aeoliella straminimaris]MCO6042776.1 TIGR03546 family protein [Aeoliella straminimaris]
MLTLLLHPVRQLFGAVLANDSPRQVAWGFTLGMMLGMVPKGNLIAVVLGILLCALRVNKPAGLLAVALFSAISPLCDGLTHKIGDRLLHLPNLQGFYAWLYDQPLGPFIGFHNTVTIGSLMLALYISYPCYYGAKLAFARIAPPLGRWVVRYRLGRALAGAQFAARFGG